MIAILGVNYTQAASVLGISKTTLSNQINGKRIMEHSTAFFLLERLGLELSKPGAIKAIIEGTGEPATSEVYAEINKKARYGNHNEAA